MNITKTVKLTSITTSVILLAGAVLRVAGLSSSAFWFDESCSVFLGKVPSLFQSVRLDYGEFNGPLWGIITWVNMHLFGVSEITLRLPSLLAGLISLWLGWLIVCRFTDNRGARLAALVLFALLPYMAWLSQDGRCYSIFSMLYLAGLLLALDGRWMGFGAILGLMLYTHPIGVFYVPVLVFAALLLRHSAWRSILAWSAVGCMTFLPWLPGMFMARKFWADGLTLNGFLGSFLMSFFANALSINLAYLAILIIIITLVGAIVITIRRAISGNDKLENISLAAFAIGPLVLMLAATIKQNTIFYRPLSAMVIPLCIWFAVTLFNHRSAWSWMLSAAWIVVIVAGLAGWNPASRGSNLREVAQQINSQWQPGDIVYHATSTTYLPLSLYLDHPTYLMDSKNFTLLDQERLTAFKMRTAPLETIPHKRAWVIYAQDWPISRAEISRMDHYIAGAKLLGKIDYIQISNVSIYLLDR